jgi:hypothetical protein
MKLTTLVVLGASLSSVLASCGGASISESQATAQSAAASPAVTLFALKLASAMVGVTPESYAFDDPAWSPGEWSKPTSLAQLPSGCIFIDVSNADAKSSVGDWQREFGKNCTRTFDSGVETISVDTTTTLTGLSDPAFSPSGTWSASESHLGSGNTTADFKVTTENHRFQLSGSFTYADQLSVSHHPDGSQTETQTVLRSSRGSNNGAGFDYTVNGSFSCAVAAGQARRICSGVSASLIGKFDDQLIEATLSPVGATSGNYEIRLKGKVFSTLQYSSGYFSISTEDGTNIVAERIALESIRAY